MSPLTSSVVNNSLEKALEKSKLAVEEILELQATIERYEAALKKYEDFQTAEAFVYDAMKEIEKQRIDLENQRKRDQEFIQKTEEKARDLEQREVVVKNLEIELNDLKDSLRQSETKVLSAQLEAEIVLRNANSFSDSVALREKKLQSATEQFQRRWTALKDLMEQPNL